MPGEDHAAVAVHRGRAGTGQAGRPSDPAKGLLPDIGRLREVSATVAVDVINTAMAAGIARVQVDDPIEAVHEAMWKPEYLPIKR